MTHAPMTRGTTNATVSVDMPEVVAATRIAGLAGMMKDAMMTGVTMTGVTMTAAMTTGDTEVDEGVGGGRMPFVQVLSIACTTPSIVDSRPRYRFYFSICISPASVDDPSTFSIPKLNVQPLVVPTSTLIILITKSKYDLRTLSLKTRPRHRSTLLFSRFLAGCS
jgi:hypothetical protein